MKKIAVFILAFNLTLSGVLAQQKEGKYQFRKFSDYKKVHWGFTIGINKYDFSIYKNQNFINSDSVRYFGIESYSIPGFQLGPLVEFKLFKYLDLRIAADISFTQRNINYYFLTGTADSSYIDEKLFKVPSSFVELPVAFKYKSARYNNMRMYILGGANPKFDFSALKRQKINEEAIKLNPLDIYYDIGLGIEWYLPYFKLSTELKFSQGFLDVLYHDNSIYTAPIDKLRSHVFMFSLHFSS